MKAGNDFFIMKGFPDFHEPGFNISEYNQTFEKKNVIIHASAKDVSYAEHWGPLSIKCVLKGAENYQCNNRFYTVDKDCYLIFNDGQHYSSYIFSSTETESFTINFSSEFQHKVLNGLKNSLDEYNNKTSSEFIEKLYARDNITTSLLKKLYDASLAEKTDIHSIEECYYSLLENLMRQQAAIKNEIKQVKAIKFSTQVELYKRLNYAKDFIHSCYMKDISLNEIASVACMNDAYFLREFKKHFGLTPHQYIIQQRLTAAKELLKRTTLNIAEICFEIGYSDATSFSKLFKKHFAFTPADYRMNKQKNQFSPIHSTSFIL